MAAEATLRAGLGNFSASEVTTAMATRSVINEKITASEVITALSTRCGCIATTKKQYAPMV